MSTITTQQGDTWDILAKRIYGSELYMDKLIKANIGHRTVVMFGAGVELEAPEVERSIITDEDEGLPPWKR